jgi:hypothetical protein
MLQRNHCVQAVDTVFEDEYGERIPTVELIDLQAQLNVNLSGDDGWLDEEIPVGYVTEIDEEEFFQRYFDNPN